MDNDTVGKYEKDRESFEYRNLINQLEKFTSRIDELYEMLKDQEISISDRKKDKIENYIEKITNEEINSLKLIVDHKEEIIRILEGLFKTPFFVVIKNAAKAFLLLLATPFIFVNTSIKNTKNNIVNSLNERKEIRRERALEREREREERALQKERDREERELQKQRDREEREALAQQKQREKEERILQKEREKEEDTLEERVAPFTISEGANQYAEEKEVEEKEVVVEENKSTLVAPSVAYYSPKEDTIAEVTPTHSYDDEEEEDEDKEEVNYLRYIIPILLLFLIGLLFFLIWSNFDSISDSLKFASDETETKETVANNVETEPVAGLAKCFPEITGSTDPIKIGNKKLEEAYYCCFENRITTLNPEQFENWKKKNFELIKCISENIPDDYMLVVVGHANRTGYEEDMKVYKENQTAPKYVVGNYTYSMERARSLIKELNNSINEEIVLYYGVGSNEPRINDGIDPENHLNRRITFKIMKKEKSKNESEEWTNKKEEVKVVK